MFTRTTSVLFEVIRNRLRREVVVSQFLSTHKCYQASILAQKWLEQLPARLEDPWCIDKQNLAQPLGVVCKEDVSLQQKTYMKHVWLDLAFMTAGQVASQHGHNIIQIHAYIGLACCKGDAESCQHQCKTDAGLQTLSAAVNTVVLDADANTSSWAMGTDQKGCKTKVAILLFEAFEVEDAQHCFLPFWQLLQRFLQRKHAQTLAVI